ncbi:Serine/threonine-protein kinase 33 [Gonapodya sp. JEL0774]|nr:Serine/threonine-protein kinase 33 [Gonapodya sp. JEL0774]
MRRRGSFGVVRLVTNRQSGRVCACKIVGKTPGATAVMEQLQREIEILKRVNSHPHIVELIETFESPKKVHLVMEYCQGGELLDRMRQKPMFTETDVRIVITRLADALAFLHRRGIVHRDLKPANILLSDTDPSDPWNIKVSDFGLGTFNDASSTVDTSAGTPYYMAPEVMENSLGYTQQCDVWSMGVMFYLLESSQLNTRAVTLQISLPLVRKRRREYEKLHVTTHEIPQPAALALLESMLRYDPASRITAQEILDHPWITGEAKDALTLEDVQAHQRVNVLDMMKGFNSERRLRRVMTVVLAAVILAQPIVPFSSEPLSSTSSAESLSAQEPPPIGRTSRNEQPGDPAVPGASSGSAKPTTPPHRRPSLQVASSVTAPSTSSGPRMKLSVAATALKVVRRRSVQNTPQSDASQQTTLPPSISNTLGSTRGSYVILFNTPDVGMDSTTESLGSPEASTTSSEHFATPMGRTDEQGGFRIVAGPRKGDKVEQGGGHRTQVIQAVAVAAGPPIIGKDFLANGKGRTMTTGK